MAPGADSSAGATVRCSFCRKPQDECNKPFVHGDGVHICSECVSLCVDIWLSTLTEEQLVVRQSLRSMYRALHAAVDQIGEDPPAQDA